MKTSLLVMFLMLFSHIILFADTFYLENGSIISGKITAKSDTTITISTKHGILVIEKEKVFYSQSEYESYKLKQKLWKRHFLDVAGIMGFTILTTTLQGNGQHLSFGGPIGINVGYQYAINKYFALGIGFSFFGSIVYYDYYMESLFHIYQNSYITGECSGASIMLNIMIGDLKDKKIAFLFDIGAAWLAGVKMGIYIRGFTIKLGYHLTALAYGHNITLDVGYKFNWKRHILNIN